MTDSKRYLRCPFRYPYLYELLKYTFVFQPSTKNRMHQRADPSCARRHRKWRLAVLAVFCARCLKSAGGILGVPLPRSISYIFDKFKSILFFIGLFSMFLTYNATESIFVFTGARTVISCISKPKEHISGISSFMSSTRGELISY